MPIFENVEFDFRPMGEVLGPVSGMVAVDVGSKCVPGVVDHHFAGAGDECAASLVAKRCDELVLAHLRDSQSAKLTIRCHREPDLDCVVAAYLVCALAENGRLPAGAAAVAEYARVVDMGLPPPDGLGPTSLWCLYAATTEITEAPTSKPEDRNADYLGWVERGFELVHLALTAAPSSASEVRLPASSLSDWEEERLLIRGEMERFAADEQSGVQFDQRLPTCDGQSLRIVRGLRVRDPRSTLFKHLARARGFTFTHVIYTANGPRGQEVTPERHVISVPPEKGLWLRGLGRALEAAEVSLRAETDRLRPQPPRWPDVTNADPWYDGRSPIHGYTIVDSPRGGTALPSSRVIEIVEDASGWIPLGYHSAQVLCSEGCSFSEASATSFCPNHGGRLVPAVVDGRYELERFLGRGGMGGVWLARDPISGGRYALKHVAHALLGSRETWERFKREATLASRVAHPNVVQQVAFGVDSAAGYYTLSEFVDGVDLAEDMAVWAASGQPYPWGRIRRILCQVCEGLEAVHAAGVLHRDLKPQNIRLAGAAAGSVTPQPIAKILDFGIATLADPTATRMTKDGTFVGTLSYASPEQVKDSATVDSRADLYALGCILYESITGHAPFDNIGNEVAAIAAKVSRPAPPLPEAGAGVPPAGRALISSLLATNPADRPQSALELRGALERL